jgi:hypothetical protein
MQKLAGPFQGSPATWADGPFTKGNRGGGAHGVGRKWWIDYGGGQSKAKSWQTRLRCIGEDKLTGAGCSMVVQLRPVRLDGEGIVQWLLVGLVGPSSTMARRRSSGCRKGISFMAGSGAQRWGPQWMWWWLSAAAPSHGGWRLNDGTNLLEIPIARGTVSAAWGAAEWLQSVVTLSTEEQRTQRSEQRRDKEEAKGFFVLMKPRCEGIRMQGSACGREG